ncbi:MAG: hypothetical protein OW723_00830 [Buchnera aphidicola (Acyrthosiphon caraganae)]|nr:MAG: hypothetical protein OW723_00830 [Buchnera aphidicola (Acyrthosiphon caraganae)]
MKKVFFSGNIQDKFPLYLCTIGTKINCQKYSNYIYLKKKILKILVFIIIF